MYSWNGKELVIHKVEPPQLDMNILGDMQQSYTDYLNKTVFLDMEYLAEKLRESFHSANTWDLKVRVAPLVVQSYSRTQVTRSICYYPVVGDILKDGIAIKKDVEFLRIPQMDDYCKLNMSGSTKVCTAVQRPSDDISYDRKSSTFNISMPYANIRIINTSRGQKIKFGSSKISLDYVIAAMMHEEHIDDRVYDHIVNSYLRDNASFDQHAMNQYIYDRVKPMRVLDKYASDQYALGKARGYLNEALTLERALGCMLSRDVGNYHTGDVVSESMLADLKRNRINEIYIYKNDVDISGLLYADSEMLTVPEIPVGTPNNVWLRERLPEYSAEKYIPVNVSLSPADSILLMQRMPLTQGILEMLKLLEIPYIHVSAEGSTSVSTLSLELEVIGNYTARLRELTDTIPDGRSADEWVYYYNNPNLELRDDSKLNAHDMLAIMSIMGYIHVTQKCSLLNRDTSFLKKTLLVGDLFSESLRSAIDKFVVTYSAGITSYLNNINASSPFPRLADMWKKIMLKSHFIAAADTTNLMAEIAQVNRVNTLTASASTTPDEMRYLALPFFGRICPYETPAGKKLGLVNTKAIGAKVIDGMLCTPYRKVKRTSNGIEISNKITYMSVKDELGKKFGDILTLQKDANGNYMNTPIIAKIPNPEASDEPFIVATIDAFDLAGGYVAAHPEQFLSPTAALIPFACCNDTNRITFGLNQIRQAIYLQNPQIPRVRTSMYEDMFQYSDFIEIKSPIQGVITSADKMHVILNAKDGKVYDINLRSSGQKGNVDRIVNLLVAVGQTVSTETVLARVYSSPKSFVVRAPYSGRITEIAGNHITIAKCKRNEPIPFDLEAQDNVTFEDCRIMGKSPIFMNINVSVNDYVEEGQILATTNMSRQGVFTPSRNPLVAMISVGYNHEDGVAITEKASVDYTSLITNSVEYPVSLRTNSGVHCNPLNGYHYCGPGDVAVRINAIPDKTMKATTYDVRATLKEHGIPFEVINVSDDPNTRKYRCYMLDLKRTNCGDKMAGRHGNKGVVSKVYKNSDAPTLVNGRPVEIMLNPCGVPSRMNLGQIYDMHLSLIAEVLQLNIITESFNCASPDEISYLMHYAYDCANTDELYSNEEFNRTVFNQIAAKYSELPQGLHEHVWSNIAKVYDWKGCFDEKGDARLYDPETDTWFENMITIGFPYFNKLVQEGDEKLNVRSGPIEEDYARITSQPQKSENSNQGQRMAEMELVALAALGVSDVLDEVLNEKSDNLGAKVNKHLQQMDISEPRLGKQSVYPKSLTNLCYMLEACGIKLELPEEILDDSADAVFERERVNIRQVLRSLKSQGEETTEIDVNHVSAADLLSKYGGM